MSQVGTLCSLPSWKTFVGAFGAALVVGRISLNDEQKGAIVRAIHRD